MKGSNLDPEDELKSALDEIKENEKDLKMVVMIAQTLFEQNSDLKRKIVKIQESGQLALHNEQTMEKQNEQM